ncbi:MAG: chemotaxis protein CheB, partial [Polyangiales bacterium]
MEHLPPETGASVLVALHPASDASSALPDELQASSPLPLEWAEGGEALRPGTVYVARPGRRT